MKGTIITRIAMMMALCMCIGCGESNPLSDTRTEAEGAEGGLFEDVPTITLHTEEREMAGELIEKTMAIYVYLVASKPAAEEIEVKYQSTSTLWDGSAEKPNTFIKRVAKGERVSKDPFRRHFTTREGKERVKEIQIEILESEDGTYKAGPPIKIQF